MQPALNIRSHKAYFLFYESFISETLSIYWISDLPSLRHYATYAGFRLTGRPGLRKVYHQCPRVNIQYAIAHHFVDILRVLHAITFSLSITITEAQYSRELLMVFYLAVRIHGLAESQCSRGADRCVSDDIGCLVRQHIDERRGG